MSRLRLFDASQLAGLELISYDALEIASVPEPAALLLLGAGLIGFFALKRNFQK